MPGYRKTMTFSYAAFLYGRVVCYVWMFMFYYMIVQLSEYKNTSEYNQIPTLQCSR